MPFAGGAQDARQRTAATIVADGLNQLPAQTPKAFDAVMQELAATGAEAVVTACPLCKKAIARGGSLPVYDLSEIVAKAL